jgi:hypothetical protein
VVVLVAFNGHDESATARTAGIALIGTGLVVGVLLAFYAVGLSEDRDREREARAEHPPGTDPDASGRPPEDPHPKPGPGRIGPHRPPPRRRDHG